MSQSFIRFIVVLVLQFVGSSLLSSQLVYQKTFGGPQEDAFRSIRTTSDTGFVMSGITRSFPSQGERDMWLLKTDGAGTTVFSRTLGNSSRDLGWDAMQTSDGGYLMAGVNLNSGSSDRAIFSKYNAVADTSWVKVQYGGIDDEALKILELPANLGYLFAGFSQSYTPGVHVEMSLFLTDINGNFQTAYHYGTGGNEYAYDIIQTSDLGYALVGRTDWGSGSWDVYVLKLDLGFNVQWARTIGGNLAEEGRSIFQTSDGGFIIGGHTASYGAGGDDGLLIKLNSSGAIQWTRTFGGAGNDRIHAVRQTSDGGYVATGYTALGFGNRDAFILKLSPGNNPTVNWSMAYGGMGVDEAWSLADRGNQIGYAISGSTTSFGAGNSDGYLVVTDTSGNSGSCNQMPITFTITSPNPTVMGSAVRTQAFTQIQLPLIPAIGGFQAQCLCTDYLNNNINGQSLVCSGASGNAYFISSLPFQPLMNWSLTNGTINSGQGDTLVLVDFLSQNSTIQVTASWSGCTQAVIDSLQITIGNIAVQISGTDSSCAGDAITYNALVTGGSGFIQYLWSNGSITDSIQVIPAQSSSFWISVLDSLGCSASDTLFLTVFQYPVIQLGNDTTICELPSQVVLDAGNPGASYFWSNGSTQQSIIADPPGLWSVLVSNVICSSSDSILIQFVPPPLVQITGTSQLCEGETLNIQALVNGGTAPYTFVWNNGATTAGINLVLQNSDTFWVAVTDINLCLGFDTLMVTVNPYPVVFLGNDTVICTAPPFAVTANNSGANFLWNTGSVSESISVLESGLYYVDVNENGCVTRDSILITFDQFPIVSLPNEGVICGGASLLLDAENEGGGVSYLWNTGDTSQFIVVKNPGIYWVSVTKCGISSVDTVVVGGGYNPDLIYIPNAFTPNGNALNEEFKIYYEFPGINMEEDFSMLIFDRWGKEIKSFSTSKDSWNGTFDGTKEAPQGVYVYRMVLRNSCFPGRVIRNGKVLLIR
jgi:gliding motility-associated-like protein